MTAPGLSECTAAFREAVALWQQVALWVCALLPLGLVLAMLLTVWRFGWPDPLLALGLFVVSLLVLGLSCAWYLFARGTHRPVVLAGVFVCALGVVCSKVDWMVGTSYQPEGYKYRSAMFEFLPPSPIWRKPRPEHIRPGAESWGQCGFFPMKIEGESSMEPSLEPNWLLIWLRVVSYTSALFLALSTVLTSFGQCRRWARQMNWMKTQA